MNTHDWMLRSSSNGVSYREGFNGKREWTKGQVGIRLRYVGMVFTWQCPPKLMALGFIIMRGWSFVKPRARRVVVQGDKIKVPEARIVAMGRSHKRRLFQCGMTKITERLHHNSNDGDWYVIFRSNVTVKDQQGGECRAYDKATINSKNQQGGWCRAY